jgi:hypothetical protein
MDEHENNEIDNEGNTKITNKNIELENQNINNIDKIDDQSNNNDKTTKDNKIKYQNEMEDQTTFKRMDDETSDASEKERIIKSMGDQLIPTPVNKYFVICCFIMDIFFPVKF